MTARRAPAQRYAAETTQAQDLRMPSRPSGFVPFYDAPLNSRLQSLAEDRRRKMNRQALSRLRFLGPALPALGTFARRQIERARGNFHLARRNSIRGEV